MSNQCQLVVVQRDNVDIVVAELTHDRQLDRLCQHKLEHLLGVASPDRQLDARVLGAEALQHLRQDVATDRPGCPDDQLAGPTAGQVGDRRAAIGDGEQRALGVWQEDAASVGQAHAAPGPREQVLPELALQRMQAGRQRRLSDAERLSRSRDSSAPNNLDERFDLFDQHAAPRIRDVYRPG
jgi:hypothetical protein